jgi:hypothetical protein
MPADTLVTTSFVTTRTLNSFLTMMINVYPFNISPNATLYLGLYINGHLNASKTYDLSSSSAPAASMIGQPTETDGSITANFTTSTEGWGVTVILNHSLLAGQNVSLTAYSTSSLWVQIGNKGTTPSYETTSATPIPLALPSYVGSQVSVKLSIGGNTDAA